NELPDPVGDRLTSFGRTQCRIDLRVGLFHHLAHLPGDIRPRASVRPSHLWPAAQRLATEGHLAVPWRLAPPLPLIAQGQARYARPVPRTAPACGWLSLASDRLAKSGPMSGD